MIAQQKVARHSQQASTLENYNLIPPPDHQMLVVGMRGSGKTTFCRVLLERIVGKRPIAILDSKPDDSLLIGDYNLSEHAAGIAKWDHKRSSVHVYRPAATELLNPKILDDWLQYLYLMGDVLVYIDELSALQQRYVQRVGLTNLMARGRERNINGRKVHSPLWLSSQRPRAIPVQAYTEAMRVVVFDLGGDADRVEVARDTHQDLKIPPAHSHGFKLYDRNFKRPFHFKALGI
ncbi:MAG: hypothetical protein ACJ8BW_23860 [Ktedonobacteraceae bacterium]